ncbi:MAG: SDR family NAD(P)-dependent oxidoreductase, partial [Candidatus Margulisiibacteriota bacterium]
MAMLLKDKVAVITGSARGIGKAIALAMAKEGANIVISDVNLEMAEATAKEISALGVKAIALGLNVAKSAEVDPFFEQVVEKMGKIDIVVNNAGITRDTLLMRMKEEDWDLVLNINLK